MKLQHFFDSETSTLSYVVFDPNSKDAIVIDSVLNYEPASSTISYRSVSEIEDFLRENELNLHLIMDTHVHADHLSGMAEMKRRFPEAKTVIGKRISEVQDVFREIYNLKGFPTTGEQFDILADEENILTAGTLNIQTIFTPGHTPACASYLINDSLLFVGDALFMPDYGAARCDFPKGSAKALYHSIANKLYQLPEEVRVFTGHDYQPNGRALQFESSIGEQKQKNIQIKATTTEEAFVSFRNERDKTLSAPRLLLPSIQVNIRAGELPSPENNEMSYLKIPVRKKA